MDTQDYINAKALGVVSAGIESIKELSRHRDSLTHIIKDGEFAKVFGTMYDWQDRLREHINIDTEETEKG